MSDVHTHMHNTRNCYFWGVTVKSILARAKREPLAIRPAYRARRRQVVDSRQHAQGNPRIDRLGPATAAVRHA